MATDASSIDINERDFRILTQPLSTYVSPVVTRSILARLSIAGAIIESLR
jgi:hypothetical protein